MACGDATLRVCEAATGRTLTVLQASDLGAVSDAAFSPDGKSIVSSVDARNSGLIEIWNAELTADHVQQYLNGTSG